MCCATYKYYIPIIMNLTGRTQKPFFTRRIGEKRIDRKRSCGRNAYNNDDNNNNNNNIDICVCVCVFGIRADVADWFDCCGYETTRRSTRKTENHKPSCKIIHITPKTMGSM